jgi:hypothetical protein
VPDVPKSCDDGPVIDRVLPYRQLHDSPTPMSLPPPPEQAVIRSKQCVQKGLEWFGPGRQRLLLTLFSATAYPGSEPFPNAAAILDIDDR